MKRRHKYVENQNFDKLHLQCQNENDDMTIPFAGKTAIFLWQCYRVVAANTRLQIAIYYSYQ